VTVRRRPYVAVGLGAAAVIAAAAAVEARAYAARAQRGRPVVRVRAALAPQVGPAGTLVPGVGLAVQTRV
jgi:hypothetical protein